MDSEVDAEPDVGNGHAEALEQLESGMFDI
jgi:hypothetical protein